MFQITSEDLMKKRDPSEKGFGLEDLKKSISIKHLGIGLIRFPIPNPVGLAVTSPNFDKGGNRKIDISNYLASPFQRSCLE